jgi:hypothetical protein
MAIGIPEKLVITKAILITTITDLLLGSLKKSAIIPEHKTKTVARHTDRTISNVKIELIVFLEVIVC